MGKLIVPLAIGLLMGVMGGGFFAVFQAGGAHAAAIAFAKKNGIKAAGDSTHAMDDSTSADGGDHASDAHAADTGAAKAEHESTVTPGTGPGTSRAAKPETHASSEPPVAASGEQAHGASPPVATQQHPPGASAATENAAATEAHQRRLVKIFTSMSAKDAARVLAQMSDNDVSVILNRLGDRQAAAILIALPAPRAAALSQMQPRRTGAEP